MAISSTIRRLEGGVRVNADGLLTDEHGNSIAGVGAISVTKNSFYVDGADGLDSNSGSANSPWKTIEQACLYATAGSTVYVLPSTYAHPITLDGVTWVLSRGAIINATTSLICYNQGTQTQVGFQNLVIKGEGVFAGDVFHYANYDWANIEVEALAIYGELLMDCNISATHVRAVFSNIFFGGADNITIGDQFFGSAGGDFEFRNCRFYSAKVASDVPYVANGCISRVAQNLDTNEIGTFLIHSQMKNIPAP